MDVFTFRDFNVDVGWPFGVAILHGDHIVHWPCYMMAMLCSGNVLQRQICDVVQRSCSKIGHVIRITAANLRSLYVSRRFFKVVVL